MLKGNRQGRDKMIKIIDWISRIMAVLLGIKKSYSMILFAGMVEPDKFGWDIVILSIIFCSTPFLGLFLAPVVREKGRICRAIIGILMFPISLDLLIWSYIVIFGGIGILGAIIDVSRWNMETVLLVLLVLLCNTFLIVYLTQYNLLFRGKPITYLRRLIVGKRENICTGTEDKSVGVLITAVENGMKNRVSIIKTIGLYFGVVSIGVGILYFLSAGNYNIGRWLMGLIFSI